MVDPFFVSGTNPGNTGTTPHSSLDTTKQTIDSLMSQQQQIQEKYRELKELSKNDELTSDQHAEIDEQMKRLSDLYSKNKSTLAALSTNIEGEKEIRVNKNINAENSNARSFSFKKFMLGCGILLLLFLGGLVAIFYSLINNPDRLATFGISGCTAVNLLQLFSIVFFGLMFFLGLGVFLINLNRLITTKNKRKGQFFIGAVLSFIVMIFVAFLLVMMLNRLSEYGENCESLGDKQLVYSQIIVKNQKFTTVDLPKSDYNKLIAPINVSFTLNTTAYKSEIVNLGSSKVTSIVLSCGNGQDLPLSADGQTFGGTCFYTQMGAYQPELKINYLDASQSPKIKVYDAAYLQEIRIPSEISVQSEQTKIQTLNSSLLVGKNPVKLKFDAASVFKDFNLPYDIKRSSECNGIWDNTSSVEFQNEYRNEGVYNVCVSFPALSDYVYTFPIRVEQGEVPTDFSVSYTITASDSNNIYADPDKIELTQLPTTLTLNITSINPDTPSTQRKLFKDELQIPSQFSDPNSFKVTIDEDKDQSLLLEISDIDRQIKTEKIINITINRETIIGNLLISPQTVGTSPFTVKLDASTTTLNDPNDEIVYFSRDFGDGIKNTNLSESIVSHTYEYDFTNENGVYYPSVTLRTKKGLTFTITGTIINVKKPETNITISLDEHPAQLASVGEDVPMSITIDGMPKKIYRNFGNGETLECDGRSCAETTHTYLQDGAYTISARVEFEDKPALEGKINLLVQ